MNNYLGQDVFERVHKSAVRIKTLLFYAVFFQILQVAFIAEKFILPFYAKDYLWLKAFGTGLFIYFMLIKICHPLLEGLRKPVFYSLVPPYYSATFQQKPKRKVSN